MFQQDIKDIKMDRSNYANNFQRLTVSNYVFSALQEKS